jgi:hypothetical protein
MVDRNIFTKMAKKILRSPKGVRSPKVIHPEREWLIGLTIGAVGFSVSVAWAVHEYALYRDITITDYTATEQIVVYRENMVKDSLDMFTQRAEEHQSLLDQVSTSRTREVVEVLEETEIRNVTDEALNVENDDDAEESAMGEVEDVTEDTGD